MAITKTVKIFKNGASQAVRLPADFRFEAVEVYAIRDETTGDVLLSERPGVEAWDDLFSFVRETNSPADFMQERPLNRPPRERDLFGDDA